MNPKILIVEDEEKIRRVLQLELSYENYDTEIASDGKEALQLIGGKEWDLVLLDIMLPKLSGLEVLRRIRKTDKNTPIILLTARDEIHDKVSGLDLGANDYVTKPFQIEELLARIRAHLRNRKATEKEQERNVFVLDDLRVDVDAREVTINDEIIDLTAREFDLLVCLIKNKNIVLTREQLIEQVWGFDYVGETNIVDVYIRYLRQKLEKPYGTKYIHTVRGVGYTVKDMKR